MSDLVQRLSNGTHPVEIALRDGKSAQGLKECLARGYMHVRFTGTRGGTEVWFAVDRQGSDLAAADCGQTSGQVRVVGELTLDYIRVRCVADIHLPSLVGTGRLEPIPDDELAAMS